jgi:3-hydroxymyristoyl/3-hydroxydecanoyl-(acyl carrier protein) dehydratase
MKFRMVDRILAWQPRRSIVGLKTVSFEEYQLAQSLGDEACLRESLLVESLFQLGNWLVVLSTEFSAMTLVVRFEEIRFVDRLRPGECLRMELTARSYRDDGVVLDGVALADGRTIAEGRGCLAALVPLTDYYDPDALRVLFSEVYLPQPGEEGKTPDGPA